MAVEPALLPLELLLPVVLVSSLSATGPGSIERRVVR